MVKRRLPRPRDPIQRAHLIVQIATGQIKDEWDDGKDPAAVELGRKGGVAGGRKRAATLTPEQRSAHARKMALARWRKK